MPSWAISVVGALLLLFVFRVVIGRERLKQWLGVNRDRRGMQSVLWIAFALGILLFVSMAGRLALGDNDASIEVLFISLVILIVTGLALLREGRRIEP